MKKTINSILLSAVLIMISCDMNQKSIGISNWSDDGKVYKWHLGSESAVDVASNLYKAMKNKDYTLVRNFLSDTVRITALNGAEFNADSFIKRSIEIDSILEARNATLNLEYSNIFSVDLDPTRGGEHVHLNYSGKYEDENVTNTWNAIDRYYIIDGKVVWWDTFVQEIIDKTE